MVLLHVATGLRQSELFALKWKDVDFKNKQLWVMRSIVQQVVGKCKTEASQKPVPLHDHLMRGLRNWRHRTPHRSPESWVFEAFPDFEPGKQYLVRSAPRRPIPATLARATNSAQYQWVGSQPQHSKLVKPAPKVRKNRFKYSATAGVRRHAEHTAEDGA